MCHIGSTAVGGEDHLDVPARVEAVKPGLGFRVQGSGSRVQGFGSRV